MPWSSTHPLLRTSPRYTHAIAVSGPNFKGHTASGDLLRWSVIGTHMTSGDCVDDEFFRDSQDLLYLSRKRPKESQLLIIGDFNTDLLPTHPYDPFAHLPLRADHHKDRRFLIEQLASSLHLSVLMPDCCPAGQDHGSIPAHLQTILPPRSPITPHFEITHRETDRQTFIVGLCNHS